MVENGRRKVHSSRLLFCVVKESSSSIAIASSRRLAVAGLIHRSNLSLRFHSLRNSDNFPWKLDFRCSVRCARCDTSDACIDRVKLKTSYGYLSSSRIFVRCKYLILFKFERLRAPTTLGVEKFFHGELYMYMYVYVVVRSHLTPPV